MFFVLLPVPLLLVHQEVQLIVGELTIVKNSKEVMRVLEWIGLIVIRTLEDIDTE